MLNTEEKKKIEALRTMMPYILKLCGWRTSDLGRMLGLSKQCISGIINGKQNISKAQYIAIRCLLDEWMRDMRTNATANLTLYKYIIQSIDGKDVSAGSWKRDILKDREEIKNEHD